MNKCPAYAVAVEQGKFQAQRVTYAANGVASIEALSDWATLAEARQINRDHQQSAKA